MLDVSGLVPGERTLRVFEIASNTGDVEVDLSVSWAQYHERVVVAFMNQGRGFGWHAYVVGDGDHVLLHFPWSDHADRTLLHPGQHDFPVELPLKGWDELDQGWWGKVIPDGDLVFIGETDFDAIIDDPPKSVVCERPGRVLVGDVEILWNCTSREAYDRAWQQAIAACRSGRPTPVGDFSPATGRFVVRP